MILESQDCARLMPDGSPAAQARLGGLKADHVSLNVELAEAEAKHRLYTNDLDLHQESPTSGHVWKQIHQVSVSLAVPGRGETYLGRGEGGGGGLRLHAKGSQAEAKLSAHSYGHAPSEL